MQWLAGAMKEKKNNSEENDILLIKIEGNEYEEENALITHGLHSYL